MAYVTVDKDGTEAIFYRKPFRGKSPQDSWLPNNKRGDEEIYIDLPKGSIRKLIGRELTWEDEPVELKED